MGLFKQMRDMKDTVNAAPDMLRNARALGAQAQELAAAQQAASAAAMSSFQQGAGAPAAGSASREPIAGVSLELYAEISKGLAAYNYDQSKAPELAAAKGIPAGDWETAAAGWNERMKQDRSVGAEFNRLYTGR